MMSKKVEIGEQELRWLYEQEELSQREIAKVTKCSKTAVANRMRWYGISPRPSRVPRQFDISKAELYRLYHREQQSQEQIAAFYGCSQSLIWFKMREYGIPSRSRADAGILARGHAHLRRDFDGGQVERAYYIGFCRGDVHVRMIHKEGGQTLEASCGSSKEAQIKLFRSLFAPYGHIWQRESDRQSRVWVAAFLNLSFDFLLDLRDEIPNWIMDKAETFRAFLAGYTDAEGSIGVSNGAAVIAWCSYDHNILHQIHITLLKLGIRASPPRIHCHRGYVNKYGIRYNQDYWKLQIGAKRALLRLFDLLDPYLRHRKCRRDMAEARANIEDRNRKFGYRGMKEEKARGLGCQSSN